MTSSSVSAIAREIVWVRVRAVSPTASLRPSSVTWMKPASVGMPSTTRPLRMNLVAVGIIPGRRITSPWQNRSSRAAAASASASPVAG